MRFGWQDMPVNGLSNVRHTKEKMPLCGNAGRPLHLCGRVDQRRDMAGIMGSHRVMQPRQGAHEYGGHWQILMVFLLGSV